MDSSEVEDVKEKERLKILERQVEDMLLDVSVDSQRLIRELDFDCWYSSEEKIKVVQTLKN
jgi:hypothetical protein